LAASDPFKPLPFRGGIHHFVSPKHLNRYVSESAWRFNLRSIGEGERVNALLAEANGRLRY